MKDLEMARRCAEALWAKDEASRALGIEIEVTGAGSVRATMTVRAEMLNGHAICHGGYVFTLADTAFAFACNAYNKLTVAAGASIDFMRPAKAGDRLVAVAAERHRGGRNGVYDVLISNQAGEMIALFRGRSHSTDKPLV